MARHAISSHLHAIGGCASPASSQVLIRTTLWSQREPPPTPRRSPQTVPKAFRGTGRNRTARWTDRLAPAVGRMRPPTCRSATFRFLTALSYDLRLRRTLQRKPTLSIRPAEILSCCSLFSFIFEDQKKNDRTCEYTSNIARKIPPLGSFNTAFRRKQGRRVHLNIII